MKVAGICEWRGMAVLLVVCAVLVVLIPIGVPFFGRGFTIGALVLILVLLCLVLLFWMMRNIRDGGRGGSPRDGEDR